MESNANNISSAGLHGPDQRQRRSETSEEVDVRQGQNALGSLSLSTGLTPSRAIVARFVYYSQHGRLRRREEKSTEFIVRSGKSEVEIYN